MRKPLWTNQEEINFIKDISMGQKISDLANKYNRSTSALELRIKKIIYDNIISGKNEYNLSKILKIPKEKIKQYYYEYHGFLEKKGKINSNELNIKNENNIIIPPSNKHLHSPVTDKNSEIIPSNKHLHGLVTNKNSEIISKNVINKLLPKNTNRLSENITPIQPVVSYDDLLSEKKYSEMAPKYNFIKPADNKSDSNRSNSNISNSNRSDSNRSDSINNDNYLSENEYNISVSKNNFNAIPNSHKKYYSETYNTPNVTSIHENSYSHNTYQISDDNNMNFDKYINKLKRMEKENGLMQNIIDHEELKHKMKNMINNDTIYKKVRKIIKEFV